MGPRVSPWEYLHPTDPASTPAPFPNHRPGGQDSTPAWTGQVSGDACHGKMGHAFISVVAKRLLLILFTNQNINCIRGRRLSYKRYTLRYARAFLRQQAAEPDVNHGTNPPGTPKKPRGLCQGSSTWFSSTAEAPGDLPRRNQRGFASLFAFNPSVPRWQKARRHALPRYLPPDLCPA